MLLRPLLDKLTPFLPGYDRTCLKNALILVLAILRRQTVCLNKLKGALGGITGRHDTKAASHYKRLIRFFDDYAAGGLWLDLLTCAFRLLRLKSRYLVLDGTSWERAGRWHHLLTLGIVYGGVAVPILWIDLAKRGTSSYAERVHLFRLAFDRFDLRGKVLLADREYIGIEWFRFLIDNGLDFCIRSRNYAYFPRVDPSGPGQPRLRELCARVRTSRKADKAERMRFRLDPGGPWLWFVVAKNPDPRKGEELMLLITTVDRGAYATVEAYLKRWKREHCFRHLKSNGFDLERLNLATEPRQRLLIAAVVVAYAVSVVEGLKTYVREVGSKRQGSGGRVERAISVFRFGLDNLSRETSDIVRFCCYLASEIRRAMTGYRSAVWLNV